MSNFSKNLERKEIEEREKERKREQIHSLAKHIYNVSCVTYVGSVMAVIVPYISSGDVVFLYAALIGMLVSLSLTVMAFKLNK